MSIAFWLAQTRMSVDTSGIDTVAVRRAIAAVFSDSAYDRSLRETVWTRLEHWIADVIGDLLGSVNGVPSLRWALVGAAVLLLAGFAARAAYLTAQSRASRGAGRGQGDRSVDPLALARSAAAEGRFMEAAQFLYAAILHELRRSERVLIDPAKTVGEYRRELAARSSRMLPDFRRFAGTYEFIVWGRKACDRPSYEQLLELAAPLIPAAHRARGRT